jgi:hypothetical protein
MTFRILKMGLALTVLIGGCVSYPRDRQQPMTSPAILGTAPVTSAPIVAPAPFPSSPPPGSLTAPPPGGIVVPGAAAPGAPCPNCNTNPVPGQPVPIVR